MSTTRSADRPWVQICNERLLPRFGVDRLLTLAGRFFQKSDVEVSFLCLRYDLNSFHAEQDLVSTISVPPGLDIRGTERAVTQTVLANWIERKPEILLVGGWPFFELAGRSSSVGVPSLFIDAGAVPHDGLEGHQLWPQLELRRQRQTFMPYISRVLPISDFIRDSQTLVDRGHSDGVRTVLLGSDHLTTQPATCLTATEISEQGVIDTVRSLKRSGRKLILNLGRFEEVGYKNSPRFFSLIARSLDQGLDIAGLILAEAGEVAVPVELSDRILCLGMVTDAEMLSIMRETDLGLSMSLWEGFNLPVVEMQNIGKPVLVFNLGAHAEVVAHPWQLCRDEDDMFKRVEAVLAGHPDIVRAVTPALTAFADRLPWSETLASWLSELQSLHAAAVVPSSGRRLLLIDVSNSAEDLANSGVIRVTRQLTRRLQADGRFDVVFGRWSVELNSYVPVSEDNQLDSYGGPQDYLSTIPASVPRQFVLDYFYFGRDPQSALAPLALIPEVILDGTVYERNRWLRYRGYLISCVLYDLIPVLHREYCHSDVVSGFASYLHMLHRADQCIAISANSMSDFICHARERHESLPSSLVAVWLPAQLAQLPRILSNTSPTEAEIRILCVSTIEPRKNHRRLIEAFKLLVERRHDLRIRMILIGNSYIGAQDLTDLIRQTQQAGLPLEWLGIVSDAELAMEYRRARFTVYPSLVEGFGIPIVESLWLGRPCICADQGVMSELAADGGCLTIDMHSTTAISNALERLATDEELHRLLVSEATERNLSGWDEYARLIGNALNDLANYSAVSPSQKVNKQHGPQDTRFYVENIFDGNVTSRVAEEMFLPHSMPDCVRRGSVAY